MQKFTRFVEADVFDSQSTLTPVVLMYIIIILLLLFYYHNIIIFVLLFGLKTMEIKTQTLSGSEHLRDISTS